MLVYYVHYLMQTLQIQGEFKRLIFSTYKII